MEQKKKNSKLQGWQIEDRTLEIRSSQDHRNNQKQKGTMDKRSGNKESEGKKDQNISS